MGKAKYEFAIWDLFIAVGGIAVVFMSVTLIRQSSEVAVRKEIQLQNNQVVKCSGLRQEYCGYSLSDCEDRNQYVCQTGFKIKESL
jgi:hypothetical protein